MLNRMKKLVSAASVFALALLLSVSAFASETPSADASAETVMNALTTGLTGAQGHMFTGIQNALPLALAVAGVILGVTIGWRVFKRMGKG